MFTQDIPAVSLTELIHCALCLQLIQMYTEASHDLSHDRTLLLKAVNRQLVAMDSESLKLLASGKNIK